MRAQSFLHGVFYFSPIGLAWSATIFFILYGNSHTSFFCSIFPFSCFGLRAFSTLAKLDDVLAEMPDIKVLHCVVRE